MMVEVCNELNAANRMGASPKKISARNFRDVIEYAQHFIQGRWFGDDPMLQLPYFTMDEIKNYRRQLKDH